jgi:hypothetical protein
MSEQGPPFEERRWQREQQIEEAKWKHELQRDDAKRAHDTSAEFHAYTNKAAMDGASLALRTLIVINGGAAIAILTFLGGVASKDKSDFTKVGAVADTIQYFAIGVALALVGMALAYFTNYFMAAVEGAKRRIWEHPYLKETPRSKQLRKLNIGFHVAAFLAASVSLILFVVGMFAASDEITNLLVK